jgi:hypothetical protein
MSNLDFTPTDIPDVDSKTSGMLRNLSSFSTSFSTTSDTVVSTAAAVMIPSPTESIQTTAAAGVTNNDVVLSKKRKIKLLPPELAQLNDNDHSKFIFGPRINTNPKSKTCGTEVEIAKSVILEDGSEFDMLTLTIDQIQFLVKNIGIC